MFKEYITLLIMLIILFDPFGNIPVFLAMLKNLPPKTQKLVIIRENIIAAVAVVAFVYTGDWLLKTLSLSSPALTISGGIILFLIALQMVFPKAYEEREEFTTIPFIVPLAIPMIAGPASLTTALLVSKQAHQSALMAAILSAIIINIIILLLASKIAKAFGKAGMMAMERLIGLVLTTIAVQMMINGFKTAFDF